MFTYAVVGVGLVAAPVLVLTFWGILVRSYFEFWPDFFNISMSNGFVGTRPVPICLFFPSGGDGGASILIRLFSPI